MLSSSLNIQVKNLDHLGIVAGIIDEMGLVEVIDERIGPHPQQFVSTGVAVKAMILNGLGFINVPFVFVRAVLCRQGYRAPARSEN
ncbi:MAG: DUF4277 domain-containing protein [Cyanobacteria bacterium P01_D01_bin.71]